MKKCPNCGADNRHENTTCYNCSADIPAEAPPQQQQKHVAGPGDVVYGQPLGGPLVGGPAEADEQLSRVGQPLGGYQQTPGNPQASASPYSTVSGPPRMRYVERERESKRGFRLDFWGILYTLVTMSIVFGGGGYAINKYYVQPLGPMTSTRSFMAALNSGNAQQLSSNINASSRVWFASLGKGQEQIFNLFYNRNQGWAEDREYKLKFDKVNGNYAKVLVVPGPTPLYGFRDEDLPPAFRDGIPLLLVKEGTEWRVDLASSYKKRREVGF